MLLLMWGVGCRCAERAGRRRRVKGKRWEFIKVRLSWETGSSTCLIFDTWATPSSLKQVKASAAAQSSYGLAVLARCWACRSSGASILGVAPAAYRASSARTLGNNYCLLYP